MVRWIIMANELDTGDYEANDPGIRPFFSGGRGKSGEMPSIFILY